MPRGRRVGCIGGLPQGPLGSPKNRWRAGRGPTPSQSPGAHHPARWAVQSERSTGAPWRLAARGPSRRSQLGSGPQTWEPAGWPWCQRVGTRHCLLAQLPRPPPRLDPPLQRTPGRGRSHSGAGWLGRGWGVFSLVPVCLGAQEGAPPPGQAAELSRSSCPVAAAVVSRGPLSGHLAVCVHLKHTVRAWAG